MIASTENQLRGYAVACVSVALAGLCIHLLQAVGYTGFSPLFAALIVSAWYGGIGPGVLGIVLSTLTAYYVLPKSSGIQVVHEDFLRASVFTLTAMIAVAVHLAARQTEENAKRGKRAAELANDAKTRLLAMVTHDLKGPLNPILMALAVAESDPIVAERAREPLRLIRCGVTEEVQLIEDLLDVARLATGKFKVNLAPLNVHDVLNKAVLACADAVREKRIELTTDLRATQTSLFGDAGRLQQVFWNLLSNAIKFTPVEGKMSISTFDGPAGRVAIEVRDTGVGISAERLPHIFNMFEQGGADTTARYGGLGLGLTICHGIIIAHHGVITARSDGEGRGATFVVRLPIHTQSPRTSEVATSPAAPVTR